MSVCASSLSAKDKYYMWKSVATKHSTCTLKDMHVKIYGVNGAQAMVQHREVGNQILFGARWGMVEFQPRVYIVHKGCCMDIILYIKYCFVQRSACNGSRAFKTDQHGIWKIFKWWIHSLNKQVVEQNLAVLEPSWWHKVARPKPGSICCKSDAHGNCPVCIKHARSHVRCEKYVTSSCRWS